jgi:hypothetical protein
MWGGVIRMGWQVSYDEAIAEDVEKCGFSVLLIGDVEPPFFYTVGLMFTYGHPELILFGQREAGVWVLDQALGPSELRERRARLGDP